MESELNALPAVILSAISLVISSLALLNAYFQRRQARSASLRAEEKAFLVEAMYVVYRFNLAMARYQQEPLRLLITRDDKKLAESSVAMGKLRHDAWAWTGSPVFPLLDAIYPRNVDLTSALRAWQRDPVTQPPDVQSQLAQKAQAIMDANIAFAKAALDRLYELSYPPPTTWHRLWRAAYEGPRALKAVPPKLPITNPNDPYEGFSWAEPSDVADED